jgi:hypothetical protein
LEGYTISDGYALNRFTASSFAAGLFLAAQLPGSYALASDLANAGSSTSNLALPLIQFSIKPRLCVLNAGEEVCRDELDVKWQSAEMRSLCLYQTDKTEPLRCWQDAIQGDYQFELMASATTDFQLREIDSDKPLSDQRFQVVYSDKKYRKARRNPWSFF